MSWLSWARQMYIQWNLCLCTLMYTFLYMTCVNFRKKKRKQIWGQSVLFSILLWILIIFWMHFLCKFFFLPSNMLLSAKLRLVGIIFLVFFISNVIKVKLKRKGKFKLLCQVVPQWMTDEDEASEHIFFLTTSKYFILRWFKKKKQDKKWICGYWTRECSKG